jgi:hypothetical protein
MPVVTSWLDATIADEGGKLAITKVNGIRGSGYDTLETPNTSRE